jgi:cardiolipin synthase A/B
MTPGDADAAPTPHARGRDSLSFGIARALLRSAERAMVRTSDAEIVGGNVARLLIDGPAAFAAWEEQIAGARRWIHFENYIFRDDRTGRHFRDLLARKAGEGVAVRVLYDWVGCWATPLSFWRPLRRAGAEVRAFAPPSLRFPLQLLRRDHRKVLAVDGGYASVAGMCLGDEWAGDAGRGIPPWRDTGVDFEGPVAAVIDQAFARIWAEAGEPLPPHEVPDPADQPIRGGVAVRVVEGEPGRSRIYRLSQFVTVGVERRLWITDPYFVAPPAMNEALAAAARDGVDVRIIMPAQNNWPIVGGMSRAGYRALVAAGVRLFEWHGPMIHAKTAVADGTWSRIGSSNMNLASLLGNWELDVAILDRDFAGELEDLFLHDLSSAVEVAGPGLVPHPGGERRQVERAADEISRRASTSATAVRAPRGRMVGRAIGRMARASIVLGRSLVGQSGGIGRHDTGWVMVVSLVLLGLAGLGFWMPRLLAWPLAFALFWLGLASMFRALERKPPRN